MPASSTAGPVRHLLAAVATLGTLVFTPATGTNFTRPSAAAKDGVKCPAGTTTVVSFVIGPTAAWTATDIVIATPQAITPADPISFDFSGSFTGIAADNGLTIVAGTYGIVTYCTGSSGEALGQLTGSFTFTDASNYITSDPATTTLPVTVTDLSTNPVDRVELGKVVTVTVTLNQSTAVGTVQFRQRTPDGASDLGAPVTVSGGTASIQVSNVPFGLYYYSAKFTPTDSTKFTAAVSDETSFAVVKPVPPIPPESVSISGTPTVGTAVTCTAGAFQNATSTGWQWLRDFDPLDSATSSTYTPTADDVGHLLRCRATGSITIGASVITSGRLSAAVAVSG